MPSKSTLTKIEEAIRQAPPEVQRRFLRDLPRMLNIPEDDLLLLKAAEPSFGFWDNPDDAIYDSL